MAATTLTQQQTVAPVTPTTPTTPTTPYSYWVEESLPESPASQESDSDDDSIIRNIRTEEDVDSAIRRAQLWLIPEYNPLAPSTNSRESPQSAVRQRRARRTSPRRHFAERLRQPLPSAKPRINCRMKVPRSKNLTCYVYHGKTYYCPEWIKPWEPRDRWMLDTRHHFFMQADTHDPKLNKVYHFNTNSVFSPSRKDKSRTRQQEWEEYQELF